MYFCKIKYLGLLNAKIQERTENEYFICWYEHT